VNTLNNLMNEVYPENGVSLTNPIALSNEVITVESDDVPENINGGKFDPYAEIEIKTLKNDDGYLSNKRNIRVKPINQSGYLEAGVVGPNYLLIKNSKVSEVCSEIRANTGMQWEHDRIFFDGKRFRNVYRTQQFSKELASGDIAYLMFTEQNSFDGSMTAGFRVDFMILSCLNGMVSPKYGWDVNFRHTLGSVQDWETEIINGAQSLTGHRAEHRLKAFAEACDTLNTRLDMDMLSDIRKQHIPKLPPLRYGEILTKFHNTGGTTVWDLMQAGTNTIWHRPQREQKVTNADFTNNGVFVDGLLKYGKSQNLAGIS